MAYKKYCGMKLQADFLLGIKERQIFCGKCKDCRRYKQRKIRAKLLESFRFYRYAYVFNINPSSTTRHVVKELRGFYSGYIMRSCVFVELAPKTNRLHYHGLIAFSHHPGFLGRKTPSLIELLLANHLESIIDFSPLNGNQGIFYITKYITKGFDSYEHFGSKRAKQIEQESRVTGESFPYRQQSLSYMVTDRGIEVSGKRRNRIFLQASLSDWGRRNLNVSTIPLPLNNPGFSWQSVYGLGVWQIGDEGLQDKYETDEDLPF